MRYLKFLLPLFLVAPIFQKAFSQPVDKVIDNYVAAIGGIDKINGIKSIRFTGHVSSDSSSVPLRIIIKGKDKIRIELSIKGKNVIEAYDGTTGWFINPYVEKKSAEKMDAEDVKEIKETLEWEGKLVNYKAKGYKVELADSEDKDSYKIKLTDKNGDVTFYYLDSSSYLINKQLNVIKTDGSEITEEMFPRNYQSVEGIKFPMSSENMVSGPGQIRTITTTAYDKIELNVEVDDLIFEMP